MPLRWRSIPRNRSGKSALGLLQRTVIRATRVICHSRRSSCIPLWKYWNYSRHFPSRGGSNVSNALASAAMLAARSASRPLRRTAPFPASRGESRECTRRLDLVKCRGGIWKERPPCSLIPTTFSTAVAAAAAADRWGLPSWHLTRWRRGDGTIVATRHKFVNFSASRHVSAWRLILFCLNDIFLTFYINPLLIPLCLLYVYCREFLELFSSAILFFPLTRGGGRKKFNNARWCKFLG